MIIETVTPQQQYICNWHDSFVNYISSMLGVIAGLLTHPEATSEDKQVLESIKMLLNGQDASDVEKDLASGIVKKSTLDKIEKMDKDIVDICFEHAPMNPLVHGFWKRFLHIQIEQNKRAEEMRLSMLQIPII